MDDIIGPQYPKQAGGIEMSIRYSVWSKSENRSDDRIATAYLISGIEVWPGDGSFAEWVIYNLDKDRPVICKTFEFKSSPLCHGSFFV